MKERRGEGEGEGGEGGESIRRRRRERGKGEREKEENLNDGGVVAVIQIEPIFLERRLITRYGNTIGVFHENSASQISTIGKLRGGYEYIQPGGILSEGLGVNPVVA